MTAPFLNRFRKYPIPAFFVLTFAIAWSLWLPLGFLVPENYLLSLPGAWAPTISALILIGASGGRKGVRRFLKKLLHWRVGVQWYLVVIFSAGVIAFLATGLGILLGYPAPGLALPEGLPREAFLAALPIIFLVNIIVGGPLAEDIGWRGYILPKLREHMPALHASLIIGVIWAIWHLPFFIFPLWNKAVGDIPFFWFMLLTTGWSVLFAWVYVNTGSILMPVLFHAAINTTLGTLGVLGQSDGILIFLILNTLLTWIIVGLILLFYGRDLYRAGTAVKQTSESMSIL